MVILKYLLIAIISMAALLLLAALILNNEFRVESAVTIQKPRQVVFDYLRHLKNQDHYSKWRQMDPDMETSYLGEDGSVGFVSAWKSTMRDVGVGEQEITAIVEGKRIETEIRFEEPFVSTDRAYMLTESTDDGSTRVTFGYDGSMKYPTNLLIPLFRGKIGNDMSDNLQALKSQLEDNSND